MPIFEGVQYYLASSLPRDRLVELHNVLGANGAHEALLENATHVITNSTEFEGWQTIREVVAVVTDKWVDRCLILGKLQPTQFYSADPRAIFSGVAACSTEISSSDKEAMCGAIVSRGGQWREGLTRDVTHLFAPAPGSDKYETAMHHQSDTRIKVVLPHWFDDSFRLGTLLPTDPYEFPDPPLFLGNAAEVDTPKRSRGKMNVVFDRDEGVDLSRRESLNVWDGRKVLLSPSLELAGGRLESISAGIKRAGGVVVELDPSDPRSEESAVAESDVLVTRYRGGPAYAKALSEGKTIGTLAWLFHVEATGVLSPPTDQLLHFPVPRKAIEGFPSQVITVTNYTGEARDYLKKLIGAMGATWTPGMSGKNTVVIAAYISGNKTDKARMWSIPIVNHTWLEDCFVHWRPLTVALEKYIVFPPGVDFSTVLGHRGVGRVTLSEVDLEPDPGSVEGNMDVDEVAPPPPPPPEPTDAVEVQIAPMPSTAASAKDAREVEREVVLEFDGGMDIDDAAPRQSRHVTKDKENQPPPAMEDIEERVPTPVPTPKKGRKAKAAPPKVPAPVEDDDDGFEIVEVDPPPTKARPKPKPKPKPAPASAAAAKSKKVVPQAEEEEEEEGDAVRVVKDPGHSRQKPAKSTGAKPKKWVPLELLSDDDEEEEVPRPGPSRTTRRRVASDAEEDSNDGGNGGESDDSVVRVPSKTKNRPSGASPIGKGKGKAKAKDPPVKSSSSVRPLNRVVSVLVSPPPHLSPKTSKDKDKDKDDKGKGKEKEVERSPAKDKVKGKEKEKASPLTRTASIRASAHEAPSASSPKRRRPAATLRETPVDVDDEDTDVPVPGAGAGTSTASHDTHTYSPPPLQRTPSRRSAATKANQKLHDVIMPDVVSFQKEMRNRNVRGSWEDGKEKEEEKGKGREVDGRGRKRRSGGVGRDDDESGEEEEKGKKKRRVSGGGARGKVVAKRIISDEEDGAEEEDQEEDIRNNKKRRISGNKKVRRVVDREEEDEEDDDIRIISVTTKKGKGKAPAPPNESDEEPFSIPRRKIAQKTKRPQPDEEEVDNASLSGDEESEINPKTIKLMTTATTLPDAVAKALTKMGVKMTDKPGECTHLIARHIARTEKFLCAISAAPFIVTDKWAKDCAAAKRILPARDYELDDPENEKKYHFKLAESLRRARSGVRVFEGKTFYVTPKVKVDLKLLKSVVLAGGGDLQRRDALTPRILDGHDERYVVSCQDDVSIWRSLAENGYAVYSTELIIVSALLQNFDTENMKL